MKIALPPDSAYSQTIGNFYVLSIPAMTGLNADYRGLQLDSVRLRREFEQIPRGTSFDAGNVYQYKLLNDVFGSLLFHPGLSAIRYTTADGDRTPVRVSVDYLVRDWRIIRDEFRVPSVPNVGAGEFSYRQKLTVSSLKVLGDAGPDSRPNPGLGFAVPTPPDAALRAQDFVLMDLETGGVILGNNPGSQYNSYTVDKSRGVIAFSDVDRSFDLARGNGISAYIVLPRDNATDPWTVPTLLPDVRGRALRAMYMAKDEMSVQVFKAADQYRIGSIDAVGTLPDLCAIGVPSQGKGRADRLYFRPADFGQRVVLDEMWLSGPTMVRDREMTIQGIENVDGRALAYIEAPAEFDFSNGYAIRRVRGVSMRARALWNPEFFKLGNDPAQNYARVAQWVTGYRRSQTEGFAMGAQR